MQSAPSANMPVAPRPLLGNFHLAPFDSTLREANVFVPVEKILPDGAALQPQPPNWLQISQATSRPHSFSLWTDPIRVPCQTGGPQAVSNEPRDVRWTTEGQNDFYQQLGFLPHASTSKAAGALDFVLSEGEINWNSPLCNQLESSQFCGPPLPSLQADATPVVGDSLRQDSNFPVELFREGGPMKSSLKLAEDGESFVRGEVLENRYTASSVNKYGSPDRRSLNSRKWRYYCNFGGCTRSFSRPSDRNRHLKSHYPEERIFACPERPCTMRFYRRDKLLDHSRRVHGAGSRKYEYISGS